MSRAPYRRIERGSNSARFVVSEGVAPSAYLLAHPGLPTLYKDQEDDRKEIVITQGTILSAVAGADGSTFLVPANGTASNFVWKDDQVADVETGATPASGSGSGSGDEGTVTVAAGSVPIGCAQADIYRPFDRNTSFAGSWITTGYVEWPMVQGINSDLAVGDMVRADSIGRPVKAVIADFNGGKGHLRVGKVVEIEKFATNFDFGLLNLMQLPSDPGALKEVYSLTRTGPHLDLFGVRKNLDVAQSVGAVRVSLTLT